MTRKRPQFENVRVYDVPPRGPEYRVLVDRLWPRGVRKEELGLDRWAKEIAPSPQLRRWFDHRPDRYPAFREAYRNELAEHGGLADEWITIARERPVHLLYAARDPECNHARVLREFLLERASQPAKV